MISVCNLQSVCHRAEWMSELFCHGSVAFLSHYYDTKLPCVVYYPYRLRNSDAQSPHSAACYTLQILDNLRPQLFVSYFRFANSQNLFSVF